jgi:hypothetical protein
MVGFMLESYWHRFGGYVFFSIVNKNVEVGGREGIRTVNRICSDYTIETQIQGKERGLGHSYRQNW